MKTIVLLLAVVAVATATYLPSAPEAVPIHHIKQWREALPELAALMPIIEETFDSRITGGAEAAIGQFPYQAHVLTSFGGGSTGLCGGSLIAPTWVLTAAHCADPATNFISVEVRLGAHNRLVLDAGEQRFPVLENIIHEGWTASVIMNDIAVQRIAGATLGANVGTIPLTTADAPTFAGEIATVSGWGRTGDGAAQGAATFLQWIQLPVISNADCAAIFSIVTAGNICTRDVAGRNICAGDSGGPLTLNGQQIGIVSFGAAAGCGIGMPAGFVRVSHFRSWITTHTGI